jgi:hypothetical protein
MAAGMSGRILDEGTPDRWSGCRSASTLPVQPMRRAAVSFPAPAMSDT